jgi:integrase
MGKLTDIEIRNWIKAGKPISGKSDGDGLTFTMSAKQAADKSGSWVLRYRMGGKLREKTIGRFPDIGLKRARELATEDRARIQQGVDVAREKQVTIRDSITAWTVRQLADDYEAKILPSLAAATIISRKQKIRDYILPAIGHLASKDVTGADVVQMLERVADKSPKLVKPVIGAARLIFAHGIAKHIVSGDPCAGITVRAIAGDTSKGEAARVMLSDAELKAVFMALPKYGRINELVIRILLSTAVRIQALTLAEWSHIDFEKKEWTIPPGDGRKSDRAFVIPLTDDVIGYFAELQTIAGNSRFVLPIQKRIRGREGDAPMRQQTINNILNRICDELGSSCRRFSPHDLRSTARSHFAALGVSLIVAERCLNHSLGGLMATYDQHDYMTERRRALELWGAKLAALESGADNVIPMAGRAA